MKVNYTISQSLIAANQPSTIELLLRFHDSNSLNRSPRRPLNLCLVLDRSGSMAGQSLRYAIQAARKLVEYLTPEDILSVVIYDDTPEIILPPQTVRDRDGIQKKIGNIRAGGCTNLSGGWLMGCDCLQKNKSANRLNRILLLTDGFANIGIRDPQVLIKTARDKAEEDIITTTLGFGKSFNEDLLIGMAESGRGNFYFIQSPDDATEVFGIEMESVVSAIAQNLTVTVQPTEALQDIKILNNYRHQKNERNLEVFLGDVYAIENKVLAASLSILPQSKLGTTEILTFAYQYQAVVDGSIQQLSDRIEISIEVGKDVEVEGVVPDARVIEKTSLFKIAQAKDEAIALADKGDRQQAAQTLRQMADGLKQKALQEFFEIAEEISQLEYYSQCLETQRFDGSIRKEMRDQSYQTRSRDREDLKLRGITAGAAESLEAIENPEGGVLVKCERVAGKLRIRVLSPGYDSTLNVQFPRSIRQEGVTYVVDDITLSANGTFYRPSGQIRRVGKPNRSSQQNLRSVQKSPQNLQTAKATGTVADLETTTTVGDGILIQCVSEGKKLRARVVSDEYDPNFNVRFPRNLRQEGILFVVDGVKETAQGSSYIALGKIKKLEQ